MKNNSHYSEYLQKYPATFVESRRVLKSPLPARSISHGHESMSALPLQFAFYPIPRQNYFQFASIVLLSTFVLSALFTKTAQDAPRRKAGVFDLRLSQLRRALSTHFALMIFVNEQLDYNLRLDVLPVGQ
jgi:hypothetical protein